MKPHALFARLSEEPSAVVSHAGICEGGRRAIGVPTSIAKNTMHMSRILRRYSGNIACCDQDLKSGKLHIVVPALNGMTNLNVFACLWGGMSLDDVHTVADRVNRTRVVETLSPIISVSLFPLHRSWKEAQTGSTDNFGNVDEVDKNIAECLQIHREQHRTKDLLFALDQGNVFDRHLVISRLESLVGEGSSDDSIEIIYDISP